MISKNASAHTWRRNRPSRKPSKTPSHTTTVQSGHRSSVGKVASWQLHWRALHRAARPVFFFASFFCAASLSPARAFTFIANPPCVWPKGNVTMVLKLGSAGRTLIDGTSSWDSVAGQALTTWNGYLGTIQFAPTIQSPGVGSDGDHVNQAFFNSTVFGQAFGSGLLAVTTGWSSGTKRTEADVTFNNAISWDSYRGTLRYPSGQLLCDLRRVALHEFGHALGLSHPDQAGQTTSAIMNSMISNLDGLASDDISGAQVLYPVQTASIKTQPQSKTVAVGNTVAFAVAASGSQPLSYQWQFNGANIPPATGPSYTISNVQTTHAGNYTVVVSNAGGSVDSAVATLTVQYGSAITGQPQSQTVNKGANVTFSVVAGGNPAPTYQWRFKSANIPGATASTYTRNNVQPAVAGSYTVVLSNSVGTAISQPATLTINTPPVISLGVSTNGTPFSAPATISLAASASDTDGTVTRVDFYEGTTLIGTATTGPFSFAWNSVPSSSYSLTAKATDNIGATATSAPVSVTVSPPMVFLRITPPTNGTAVLNVSGPTGRNLTIYDSLDLHDWLPIVTVPNPTGALRFTNAAAGSFKSRFYKATAE